MGVTIIVNDNDQPVIYNEKPYNPINPMQI